MATVEELIKVLLHSPQLPSLVDRLMPHMNCESSLHLADSAAS